MFKDNFITLNIKTRIKQVLFSDAYIPPELFFAFVLLKEIQLFEIPSRLDWLFYTGVAILLLSCFNCYLFYLGILNNLGILTPFNLIIGILSSNQKYKLYLTVFTVIYYLPITESQLQQLSIILLSLLICTHIFNEMIFPNKKQNIWFYCGFFSIGLLEVYVSMLVSFGVDVGIYEKLWIGLVLSILGWIVIHMRIKKLMKKEEIYKSVGIVALRVSILEEEFKVAENIRSYLFAHKHTCYSSTCFCSAFPLTYTSTTIILPPPKQILNFIFLNHFQLNSWEIQERQSLTHHYISFLIECKQYVKAMETLTRVGKSKLGFFGMCEHWRITEKLRARISKDVYFDKLDRKMEYIQKYDMELGYINKEIREILLDKVQFWKELCKENPKLLKLEINGQNLVKRIESLHEYFMLKMRPCEEALSFFKCTFIYASYLLLTTNYVEFANSLTKKSHKVLEEKKGHSDNGKEFGLFLEICELKRLDGKTKEFQLIITNISSSLCAFLGKEKEDLLNNTLAQIIPNEFLFLHDIGFNNFVKTKDFEKSTSVLIGKTLELPFKINDDHAIFLHLSSELRFDPITNKPSVQCMLKKVTNDAVHFIMNLDGKLLYRESELFKDYSHHYSVKNALEKMKMDYERESILEKLETEVEEEENIIKVECIPLFSNKLILHNKEPLVKVVLKSDNFKNEKIRIDNFETSNKVKQHVSMDKDRIAQETDSQASNSSRRDSIENVLSNLMEANPLRKEPFLTLILIGLGVVSIVCFIFVRDFFEMWDTSKKEETPAYTIMIMINMKTVFNLVINQKFDFLRNYADPEAKVRIRYALHEGKTQEEYVEGLLTEYLTFEKVYIYEALFGANNEVSKKSKELFQKEIMVTNPEFPSMGVQNMTLQGLIVNMVTSIYYVESGKNFRKLLLYYVYLPIFHKEFTDIINICIEDVKNKISELRKKNIILITLVDICILLFLAPIWVFNWGSKKERLKIYNLFACLEAKLIVHEIKKLETIDSSVFAHSNKNKNTNESLNKVSSFGEVNKTEYEEQKDNEKIDNVKENENSKENRMTKTTKDIHIGKIRKRGADLDIKESDCDRMKFLCSDSIPLWFMLVFFAICNIVFFNKYRYIDTVENQFYKSIGVMSYVEDMNIAIINTKRYIDEYTTDRRITFQEQDLEDWIKNWILKTEFKEEFEIGIESEIQNCTTKNLICSKPHSMLLLQGLAKKTISDGFEAQRAYLTDNSTENFETMDKSREALVDTTFLLNEFGVRYNGWLIENFGEFENNQLEMNAQITMKSTIFWVFLAIFFISSVVYTKFRKNNYVTEVTLLSLLSKEMLYNNKSVESFVHRLSKSLR